jgi:hypothetical protein
VRRDLYCAKVVVRDIDVDAPPEILVEGLASVAASLLVFKSMLVTVVSF